MREAALRAGLSSEATDVFATYAASVDATFLLVYEVASEGGGTARVEVRQRPPRRRLDVIAPDGTTDATITDGEVSYHCLFDGTWRCDTLGRTDEAEALGTEFVDTLTASLLEHAPGYDFTVEQRTELGEPARCLITTRRADAVGDETLGDRGELCIAADGAVLLLSGSSGTLRALEHRTEVPDDAFELPAPPLT